jgi:hypothetical protein
MDFGKALTFITDDPRWTEKVAIGAGVVIVSMALSPILIGIVGFMALSGYAIRLLQNVADGQTFPLPEWNQWTDDIVRGLKYMGVGLVWALPVLILAIPNAIGSSLLDTRGSETAAAIGVIILFCGACLTIVYCLFLAVVTPGYTIAFARDERFGSGLHFREILEWTWRNIGQVVVVALVVVFGAFGLLMVTGIVGLILCFVGVFITVPLAVLIISLFQYHLYGQLASTFPMSPVAATPSPLDPDTLVMATPPSDMAPGVSQPTTTPPSDLPSVSSTGEYPESGISDTPSTDPNQSTPPSTPS